MQTVILAGGKGSRLKPFTITIPKPLMPIQEYPILEIVVRQLRAYGFQDIVLSVNHLANLFMAYFADGKSWNVNIRYSLEDQPLGTAGPLRIVPQLEENFLVMNGDVLTTLNYRKFSDYHHAQKNDVTIAAYRRELKIDLGVLEIDGDKLVNYHEKPIQTYWVSTGVYMFNRRVVEYIPKGEKMDMPTLMILLRDKGFKVRCFQDDFYWLDIGRLDDYEEATKIFHERAADFLPS
jgi:NDP-sugar pyrophosphorylase family protein